MISGLVIHLSPDEHIATLACREIAAHPAIETGERQHARLPLVAETTDVAAMHELTDWLASRDGVTHVDVAFADVASDDALESPPSCASQPGNPKRKREIASAHQPEAQAREISCGV